MKQNTKLIAACIIAILAACLSPYNGGNGGNGGTGLPNNGGGFDALSELFLPINDGTQNTTNFFTNDPKYRNPSGYTLWTYCSDASDFIERTVTVKKTLGNIRAGFGLVICSNQRQINGQAQTVFLTVMINNNQEYAVGKVIGASYTSLLPSLWYYSNRINEGIGWENAIKIVKDNYDSNKYHLYINGYWVNDFSDNEQPQCNGQGRNGYIVVIAQDDLNGGAVAVNFSE